MTLAFVPHPNYAGCLAARTLARYHYIIHTRMMASIHDPYTNSVDREQYKRLKEISHRRHKSLAELIRGAVDGLLISEKPDQAALYRRAGTVVGKHVAEAEDIAVEHDRYLDDAYSV